MSFLVFAVHNLPNLDGFAGATDPYFRVRIHNVIRTSSVVLNNNNGAWLPYGEELHLGMFDTFTDVIVEVWNSNGGFLGADGVVGSFVTNVPACNQYAGELCQERTRVYLHTGLPCYLDGDIATPDVGGVCVEVGFRIRPFVVRVLAEWPSVAPAGGSTHMSVAIANEWFGDSSSPYSGIWTGNGTAALNVSYPPFADAAGGYVVKVRAQEQNINVSEYVSISVNYPSTLFVFRYAGDVAAVPALPWLQTFSLLPVSGMAFPFDDTHVYVGYRRPLAAGEVITLPSHAYQSPAGTQFASPYAVVVRFTPDSTAAPAEATPAFDKTTFVSLLVQAIILTLPILPVSMYHLRKVGYRCVRGVLCVPIDQRCVCVLRRVCCWCVPRAG